MKIKTASGVEFDYDMISEIPNPPRLYIHLLNTTLSSAMPVLFGEGGLPFEGYEDYRFVQSVADGYPGVNISLKKTFD